MIFKFTVECRIRKIFLFFATTPYLTYGSICNDIMCGFYISCYARQYGNLRSILDTVISALFFLWWADIYASMVRHEWVTAAILYRRFARRYRKFRPLTRLATGEIDCKRLRDGGGRIVPMLTLRYWNNNRVTSPNSNGKRIRESSMSRILTPIIPPFWKRCWFMSLLLISYHYFSFSLLSSSVFRVIPDL